MALDLESLLQPLDPLPASGPQNPPPRPRQPLWWRIGQWLSAYLPLVLMGLLALATWWLVRNTPRPDEPREPQAARHEADYLMNGFTLRRFAPDGALRVQIEGTQMRHFPDTNTLEIDRPTIRATGPDGSTMLATAQRAIANGDGSEMQLVGQARVRHEDTSGAEPVEFEGEFLHAFFDTERVRSHLPVHLRQGTSDLRVAWIEYDHLARSAKLGGPLRAQFDSPAARR